MGKSKGKRKTYRIILAGYQEIKRLITSRLVSILGVLVKLGKATFGFVTSICPAITMEQFVCHWIFKSDI
jgi:hypothetical protein